MRFKTFCNEYGLNEWDPRSQAAYEYWQEQIPTYTVDELAKKGKPFIIFDSTNPDHVWALLTVIGIILMFVFFL